MRLGFPKQLLRQNPFQRIRHIPGQTLTYLQNPKVACTSIELALWRQHSGDAAPANPHFEKVRPYIKNIRVATPDALESLLKAEFFSVVRNPFARVLSAYLDKVGVNKRPWARISKSLGLSADKTPTISELLVALQSCDPYVIDHHFRPQHVNLLHGLSPLDFIGHIEKMDVVAAYLNKHGFGLQRDAKHATNAASRLRLLADKDVELIRRFYGRDFDIYGYSDDPDQQAPVRPSAALFPDRALLRGLIERRAERVRTDRFHQEEHRPSLGG